MIEIKYFVLTIAALLCPFHIPQTPVGVENRIETEYIQPISAIQIVEEPEAETLPEDDIELLALVTMAEAEDEPEEGKRLVIDTILNRVDSEDFPNTVHDVVYQKAQFTSMWNGRVDRCEVREDICQLVREELAERTNSEAVYFRTGHYSKYGTPLFQVGGHYFSSH